MDITVFPDSVKVTMDTGTVVLIIVGVWVIVIVESQGTTVTWVLGGIVFVITITDPGMVEVIIVPGTVVVMVDPGTRSWLVASRNKICLAYQIRCLPVVIIGVPTTDVAIIWVGG